MDEFALSEFAFEHGAVGCKHLALSIQQVILKIALFHEAILGRNLAFPEKLLILEVALDHFAISLGNDAAAGELAVVEVALDNGAVALGDSSRPVHYIFMEGALANGAVGSDYFSGAMQVVILELSDGALVLVDVAAEAVDAVEAVSSHFEFALVEELGLFFALMADDVDAADLAGLAEIFAVLNLNQLFNPANSELATEFEVVFHDEILKIKCILLHILEQHLISVLGVKRLINRLIKHILHNIILILWNLTLILGGVKLIARHIGILPFSKHVLLHHGGVSGFLASGSDGHLLRFEGVIGNSEVHDALGSGVAVDVLLDLECLLFFLELFAFDLQLEGFNILDSLSFFLPDVSLSDHLLPLFLELGPVGLELLIAIILPLFLEVLKLSFFLLNFLLVRVVEIGLLLEPVFFLVFKLRFLSIYLLSHLRHFFRFRLHQFLLLLQPRLLGILNLLKLALSSLIISSLNQLPLRIPVLSLLLKHVLLLHDSLVLVLRLSLLLLLPLLPLKFELVLLGLNSLVVMFLLLLTLLLPALLLSEKRGSIFQQLVLLYLDRAEFTLNLGLLIFDFLLEYSLIFFIGVLVSLDLVEVLFQGVELLLEFLELLSLGVQNLALIIILLLIIDSLSLQSLLILPELLSLSTLSLSSILLPLFLLLFEPIQLSLDPQNLVILVRLEFQFLLLLLQLELLDGFSVIVVVFIESGAVLIKRPPGVLQLLSLLQHFIGKFE